MGTSDDETALDPYLVHSPFLGLTSSEGCKWSSDEYRSIIFTSSLVESPLIMEVLFLSVPPKAKSSTLILFPWVMCILVTEPTYVLSNSWVSGVPGLVIGSRLEASPNLHRMDIEECGSLNKGNR